MNSANTAAGSRNQKIVSIVPTFMNVNIVMKRVIAPVAIHFFGVKTAIIAETRIT